MCVHFRFPNISNGLFVLPPRDHFKSCLCAQGFKYAHVFWGPGALSVVLGVAACASPEQTTGASNDLAPFLMPQVAGPQGKLSPSPWEVGSLGEVNSSHFRPAQFCGVAPSPHICLDTDSTGFTS